MAIKLVNGLIDTSAPPNGEEGTGVSVDSKTGTNPDSCQFAECSPPISHPFDDELIRGLSPKAQAALEKLKRYSAGREREELRSFDQAEQLARLLAARIVEDDEGACAAHSELTTCTAQEHLMQ
jgi:hypothetical protein